MVDQNNGQKNLRVYETKNIWEREVWCVVIILKVEYHDKVEHRWGRWAKVMIVDCWNLQCSRKCDFSSSDVSWRHFIFSNKGWRDLISCKRSHELFNNFRTCSEIFEALMYLQFDDLTSWNRPVCHAGDTKEWMLSGMENSFTNHYFCALTFREQNQMLLFIAESTRSSRSSTGMSTIRRVWYWLRCLYQVEHWNRWALVEKPKKDSWRQNVDKWGWWNLSSSRHSSLKQVWWIVAIKRWVSLCNAKSGPCHQVNNQLSISAKSLLKSRKLCLILTEWNAISYYRWVLEP